MNMMIAKSLNGMNNKICCLCKSVMIYQESIEHCATPYWCCGECEQIYVFINVNNVPMQVIPPPFYRRIREYNKMHGTSVVNYFDLINDQQRQYLLGIGDNWLHKKIFNFIQNELTGILNRFKLKSYSFDYYGHLLEEEFVNKLMSILRKNRFFSLTEFPDKKGIKDDLIEFLTGKSDEDDVSYSPCIMLTSGWNDQQIALLKQILL